MPPEALPVPLAADIVPSEELAENAAVGETADAIAALRELGHFESARPGALVAVADVDLGARGERGPCVRFRPPSAHTDIVLILTMAA